MNQHSRELARTCKHCGALLLNGETCVPCRKARYAFRIANDPAFKERQARNVRDANLRRKFGVTLAWYEAKFIEQGGVCAICGDPPGDRDLAVDHDHVTLENRGLLCNGCNVGIGMLRDSPDLLRKALAYLERDMPAAP